MWDASSSSTRHVQGRTIRPDRLRPPAVPADPLGATPLPDGGVRFVVWAPRARAVDVVCEGQDPVRLDAAEGGHHTGTVATAGPGTRYHYRLHGGEVDGGPRDLPDPASRHQPDGVHGPSAVDDPVAFAWTDHGFAPPDRSQLVVYELHVGTFTPEGTFDAVVPRLADLAADGITAIELMPVAQFPGHRNWGYDGVLPYAVQDSYGGPDGLRRLVDAAHAHGIAVVLDVVFNHVGPEGNVLDRYGPYFTDRHGTPWGAALNTDGPDSDAVRRWVVDNAVRWVREFHLDGLRLDAVHAIVDQSATHLLAAIADAVHAEGRRRGRAVWLVAESDLQDPRLIRSREQGGYGMDAQWLDDLHHVLHTALTGEHEGYYVDYHGLADLPALVRDRYLYAGRWSPFRRRTVGVPAPDLPHDRFVVCLQNHDQVGNRAAGDRLTTLVGFEARKAATALLLTGPWVPMLFMGEEYAEPAPFPYVVSHTDPDLVEAVRRGRRAEFADFAWQGEVPDPAAEATFGSAVLSWHLRDEADGEHGATLALHRDLLALRRLWPPIADPAADDPTAVDHGDGLVALTRTCGPDAVAVVTNLGTAPRTVALPGAWVVACDTATTTYGGPGPDRTGDTVTDAIDVAAPGTVVLTSPPHPSPFDQGPPA